MDMFDAVAKILANEIRSRKGVAMPSEAQSPIESFQDALGAELSAAEELMLQKQHDYGPGNIMDTPLVDIIAAWDVPGIDRTMAIQLGVYVRLFDKISRLKEGFMNAGKTAVPGESLEDTWRDIVGYGIIALMVRHGTFTMPLNRSTDSDKSVLLTEDENGVERKPEQVTKDDVPQQPTELTHLRPRNVPLQDASVDQINDLMRSATNNKTAAQAELSRRSMEDIMSSHHPVRECDDLGEIGRKFLRPLRSLTQWGLSSPGKPR